MATSVIKDLIWKRKRPTLQPALVAVLYLALTSGLALSLSCHMAWEETVDIDTSTGLARVNGMGLRYHPINQHTGTPDEDVSLTWRLAYVAEVTSKPSAPYPCADQQEPLKEEHYTTHRTLEMENASLSCTVERISRPVALGIVMNAVSVVATWPEYPSFSLTLEISTVTSDWNDTVGSGPWTDGLDYTITHRSSEIKTAIRLTGWPWSSDNSSYLIPYFRGAAAFPTYANVTVNNYQSGSTITVDSPTWTLVQKQDNFLVLDGEPVLKKYHPGTYVTNVYNNRSQSFPFFFPFTICRHPNTNPIPHYTDLRYDPQFSSLFTGQNSLEPSPGTISPNSPLTRSSKSVVIAAGVIVPVVILAVLGIVIYFVFIEQPATQKAAKAALTKGAPKEDAH